MTQIVTVSPTTAAYASQAMKPEARNRTPFEQRIHMWSEDARVSGDARTLALVTLIKPPALALALITAAGEPQRTLAEAQRLYDENAG
ncbi:hypothetical protein [Shinella pollutisoli]|uniref:Uncharacterized protein n=1 Tax=Shinella pollutisoli TaxID=2250594 RepID=A0ABV7DDE6_9HYPH|nr:hypothetical protein [Shinella pollutisoli]